MGYVFSNYQQSGVRRIFWFVNDVLKYHRPTGEILTTLAHAGFHIIDVVEPVPESWALQKNPALQKEFLKPNFLIVKAEK